MLDLPPFAIIAAVFAALLLYALLWRAVRRTPAPVKITARFIGAILVIGLGLWFVPADQAIRREMSGATPPAAAPEMADRTSDTTTASREPAGGAAPPPFGAAPPPAANGHSPSGGAARPSPTHSARPRIGAPRAGEAPDASGTMDPPPQLPEAAPPEVATAPPPEVAETPDAAAPAEVPSARTEPTGAPAADVAAEEEKEWNIVPVFYGTDRKRVDVPDKVAYDGQRGRRLEMGRALVTIPKDHVVPMVERPWAIRIPFVNVTLYEAAEDPKKHFTISELKALTKEEFLALVKARLEASARFEDHALVFVHGYNTTFENALYRTAQITYDLKFDGAPFLYSWPSGATLQSYTYDRESAAQAERFLREFLEMVVNETGAKQVSVIAHSMGNQLLLRVLQDLRRTPPEGVRISQLILAAPDVDRDSFENIVRSIGGVAQGITLYSAANDQALMISRRFNGGIPRAGDVPDDGPIIVEGVDTIDATASSMDSIGINHSGYAENNALLEDIGRLILSGLRPPEKRVPTLERVVSERGTYWRYRTLPSGIAGGGAAPD